MTKEEIELMDKFALAAFAPAAANWNGLYTVQDIVSGSYTIALLMIAERRKRLKEVEEAESKHD